jgi:hypothetical protein
MSYGGGGYGGGYGKGGGGRDNYGSGLRTIDWGRETLSTFEKNFYMEHPAVTARSEESANEWRREKEITINGTGIPKVALFGTLAFCWWCLHRTAFAPHLRRADPSSSVSLFLSLFLSLSLSLSLPLSPACTACLHVRRGFRS